MNLKEGLNACKRAIELCPQSEYAKSVRDNILSMMKEQHQRQMELAEARGKFWGMIRVFCYWAVICVGVLLVVGGVITGLCFLGRWLYSIMPFSSEPASNSPNPSILPPTQPPQISPPTNSPDVDFSFIALCLDHGFIFGILAGIMLTVMFFLFGERYFKVVGIPCVVAGMGIALVLSYVFPGFVPYWNGTGFILSFIFTLLATILPMFFRRN